MRLPQIMHLLKIWDPKDGKILRRVIFKNQAVVGSDQACDVRLPELIGLAARIQFSEQCVEYISEGRSQTLNSNHIFTIGPYAILWTSISWRIFEKWKWTIAGSLALIFVAGICALWVNSSPPCNQLETKLAKGQWSTRGLRDDEIQFLKVYRRKLDGLGQALEEKSWIKLQSEIRDLEKELDQRTDREGCQTDRGIKNLRFKMNRIFFREHLQKGELEAAVGAFDEILGSNLEAEARGLKKELLKSAREMYLEGYRLEEDEPEMGNELKDRSTEICQKLGLESCLTQDPKSLAPKE